MYKSAIKTTLMLLLSSGIMPMQAFEVKLFVKGDDIISPLFFQIGKAPEVIKKALTAASKAIDTTYIPCLSQYKDGNIQTTYIQSLDLTGAGLLAILSIPCFKIAWDAYQNSKNEYYSYKYREKKQKWSYYFAALGSAYVGIAAAILCSADKLVTVSPV